jgi:hypothetical protein
MKVKFSHIEHILHNHFATFRWPMVVSEQAQSFIGDGILGLIIEVVKGGISSN